MNPLHKETLCEQGSQGSEGSEQPLSKHLDSGEIASVEQLQRVRKLVREGVSEEWACREALAAHHPLDCDCEVCS